jgi:hypothetical protein
MPSSCKQLLFRTRPLDLQLKDRAGFGHLRAAGEQRIDIFVKAAARPDHLQISLADHRPQAPPEFAQGRFMHGLNRHPERHAKNDGDKGKQRRHPSPGQRTEKNRR